MSFLENIIQNKQDELFLTKNYEITTFTKDKFQGFYSNNFVVRITNTFITALNNAKLVLPAAILVMLDNKFLKEDYWADLEMPRLVEKLLDNILLTVRTHKKQIKSSYWADHEPKIILLRPFLRPAYSLLDPQKTKTHRWHYGQEVERITAHYRVTYLNVDELNSSQRVLFDDYGNLSSYGIEQLWKSISDYFQRSDRDEYYAIKNFRAPKKSTATQTYTQQSTIPKSTQPEKQNLPIQAKQVLPQQQQFQHHAQDQFKPIPPQNIWQHNPSGDHLPPNNHFNQQGYNYQY